MGATAVVLALSLGLPGHGAALRQLAPGSLRAHGPVLHLPSAMLGYAWARRRTTLALVVKPTATGAPIRIVDVRTLHVRRTISVGDRDVCGLTYDGSTLVALAADRPCYWPGGRFEVLRFRAGTTRVVPVPAIHTAWPTNLAFGDGKAYVTHAGGGVNVVDLRTGATTPHWPRRELAKGEGIVWTRWLGGHLLGVGSRIVDVQTWRFRSLAPGARGVAAGESFLVEHGHDGIAVYTRAGRLRYRALRGIDVVDAWVVGRYVYAEEQDALEVVDLRSGRSVGLDAYSGLSVLLEP